ncbi:GNAT family N-acetyltransferase [Sporosarcina sp. P7]|uniref:GNAT family N-acetyltransferase n=1 Tax=Sporosarcina sp. P7 TaxID=2048244 RepID=UPI000C16B809|nr:GNAT family N-acetyltransferase [Sporosarcina sp. P7]PID23867.1 hypothetical protein CSV60_12460 [Sporosarcina sp. P7]
MKTLNLFIKRIIDFLGSVIGVIIISPILLIIAFSIKLTSKGPVFFTQERLGKNGKVFKIIKFRTMVVNAEKLGDGLTVKSNTDNRITKVGKILRATSLDELPQLFNIIVGQMSLVGPRPPVTYFPYDGFGNYPDWAKRRFTVRPGVTGLAQVTVRNSVSWDDRIVVDNKYIDAFNVWFDIKILFKTIITLLKTENIYMKTDNTHKKNLCKVLVISNESGESVIKGEKVYLRPILKKDITFLNEWKNDEETYRYLGGGFMPVSIDQQEKWMDSLIDTTGNNKRFVICDNENSPLGMIGLYSINWINRTCEIGLYIGNKQTKGKGYGKESCRLIERFAKEYLNLRKIKLNVVCDNESATYLWQSLGYEKIGEFKEERFIKGEYKDLVLMEKFI